MRRDACKYGTCWICYEPNPKHSWSILGRDMPLLALLLTSWTILPLRDTTSRLLKQRATEGFIHWSTKFRWIRFQNGVLHAKIHIVKRKMFAAEIEAWRAGEKGIKMTLTDLKLVVQELLAARRDAAEKIRPILEELVEWRSLLGRMSSQQLNFDIFRAMVLTNLYVREDSQAADSVKRIVKVKGIQLDELDLTASVFTAVDWDIGPTVTLDPNGRDPFDLDLDSATSREVAEECKNKSEKQKGVHSLTTKKQPHRMQRSTVIRLLPFQT